MSSNCNIVPWFNSEEWHKVYEDIFSDNTNKQVALNLLQSWKARCPSLPSGIESTLCLLQVHVQDVNSCSDVTNDQILRLAYSSSLMRYVNHTLDTEIAKGVSLYQAAKILNVPDWIIDLRHDVAHSNNLPSLELLRNACKISLQWLQHNYWDKHKLCIKDFVCGIEGINSDDEINVITLLSLLSSLSICKHSKIKKLSDLPDIHMQNYILESSQQILGGSLNVANLKTVSIASLINLTCKHGKKCLNSKITPGAVNKALLAEDSIFLSVELVEYVNKSDFYSKHKLCKSYIQCFEVLLTFLHTNDLIPCLLSALIELTQKGKDPNKSLLAALWTSEILKALKISKKYQEKARLQSNTSSKENSIKLYHHWFPNEKITGLVLDLDKPVPNKLTNLSFIQPIVSSYNPYLTYFVYDLLVLVEPNMPKAVIDKICKLAKLISTPDEFPVQLKPSKIYTVEDISQDSDMKTNEEISYTASGIWNIAPINYDWASCPIGQLPWHQIKDVPME